MDFSDLSLTKLDFLSQLITLDTVNDFEYLTWVFEEASRISAPS